MLRDVGIEPPKFHDVGGILLEHKNKFPFEIAREMKKVAGISKQLRKERELAFYGEIDFIPTEEYTRNDAKAAIKNAHFVVKLATKVIPK